MHQPLADHGIADECGPSQYVTHYVETSDDIKLDQVRRGHTVALEPVPSKAEPLTADLSIRDVAAGSDASSFNPESNKS